MPNCDNRLLTSLYLKKRCDVARSAGCWRVCACGPCCDLPKQPSFDLPPKKSFAGNALSSPEISQYEKNPWLAETFLLHSLVIHHSENSILDWNCFFFTGDFIPYSSACGAFAIEK